MVTSSVSIVVCECDALLTPWEHLLQTSAAGSLLMGKIWWQVNTGINKKCQTKSNKSGRRICKRPPPSKAGLLVGRDEPELFFPSLVYLAFFFFFLLRRPGESCLWSINTSALISQRRSVAVNRLWERAASSPENPPQFCPQSVVCQREAATGERSSHLCREVRGRVELPRSSWHQFPDISFSFYTQNWR